MIRLRPSELTLTPDDVEQTFRRMAQRQTSTPTMVASSRTSAHPGRPLLRRGPQRSTRDAITILGDIPILRPRSQQAVHVSLDEDEDEDDSSVPLIARRDSVAGTSQPQGHTFSARVSASPGIRTIHLPFRLAASRHSTGLQSTQNEPTAAANSSPPAGSELANVEHIATIDGAGASQGILQSEFINASDTHAELRGGGSPRKHRAKPSAQDASPSPSPPTPQPQPPPSPLPEETQTPRQHRVKIPETEGDLPTKILRGNFTGDGTEYSFEEFDLTYPLTEPHRGRNGSRLSTLTRSRSGERVVAVATPTRRHNQRSSSLPPATNPLATNPSATNPPAGPRLGMFPPPPRNPPLEPRPSMFPPPPRDRMPPPGNPPAGPRHGLFPPPPRGTFRDSDRMPPPRGPPWGPRQILSSSDMLPVNQASVRSRQFGSSSSSSAGFSYYGSELLPSQNTSREASSVDEHGSFEDDEVLGRIPRSPRGSSQSLPFLAPSGQAGVSPLPSRPYARGQPTQGLPQTSTGSNIGRNTMDGHVDAATAAAQNRSSPLEGVPDQYQNLAQGTPARQTMTAQPSSSQHSFGSLGSSSSQQGAGVPQPGAYPYPNPYPYPYQNPHRNPYQNPYQPYYPSPYQNPYHNPYQNNSGLVSLEAQQNQYIEQQRLLNQAQRRAQHVQNMELERLQERTQRETLQRQQIEEQRRQQQAQRQAQQQQQQQHPHRQQQHPQQQRHSQHNHSQPSSQNTSSHPPSAANQTSHSTRRNTQAPRATQRSSENVPVDSTLSEGRTPRSGQVQTQAAAFESLHIAAQASQAPNPRRPERDPSRLSAPPPALPRNISNRPRSQPPQQPVPRVPNRSSTAETSGNPPASHQPREDPQNEPSMRGGATTPPRHTSRQHSADRPLRTHTRLHREQPITAAPGLNLRPIRSPLTVLALDHGSGATTRLSRSPLVRAGAAVRTQRRLPVRQRNQENSGEVELTAMRREEAGIRARYSEEERGEVMDETPPPVGRVERRMFE